jgi:hypothetical protein
MVKSHQFWVGFVLGIVAYLAYVHVVAKKMGGGGG